MLASRWEPSVQMNRLRREMDRLFDHWGNGRPTSSRHTFPPLNLWANDEQLIVEAELPGFELEDLEITVTGGNRLRIAGERRPPEHQEGQWLQRERGFGKFQRSVDLPAYVDSNNVSAHLQHGVLTLTMPKREEARPRRIEVKVGD